MNKLVHSLGLTVALASLSLLAGCELYFGGHGRGDGSGGGDRWNYCGSDGYYTCEGDNCQWASPTCPGQTGYDCKASTDCAAGCYCANGTCEEGGFCAQDSDCGSGYHCNTSRSSCEPNTTPPPPPPKTCDWDSDCPSGQYCEYDHKCVATCTCATDAEAIAGGWGWCDETRNTCLPGADPNGSCAGDITCTTAQPTCPAGQVAKSFDGCWTNECVDYASCDVPATCGRITDETNCMTRSTDCYSTYTGINCKKSNGTACQAGDTGCTCDSFVWAKCNAK
jgi:hypothetical protein